MNKQITRRIHGQHKACVKLLLRRHGLYAYKTEKMSKQRTKSTNKKTNKHTIKQTKERGRSNKVNPGGPLWWGHQNDYFVLSTNQLKKKQPAIAWCGIHHLPMSAEICTSTCSPKFMTASAVNTDSVHVLQCPCRKTPNAAQTEVHFSQFLCPR